MKEKIANNYNEVSSVLNQSSLKLHPAQVHGLICGVVCGSKDPEATAWETLVTGDKEKKKTRDILQQMFDMSYQQLQDFLFDFQLLLPADDVALKERAEALTLWCQGFLTGLKLANVKIVARDPSDVTEAINDLIEIAKMNYEEVVASEEDEEAYIELVEYVRMAIILIYQDLHEAMQTQQLADTNKHLH